MAGARRGKRPYRHFRGDLLFQLREARGLTQQQLADEIHTSRFVISKWETGRDNPEPNTAIRIHKFFEKPEPYFYDHTEQQSIEAYVLLGHLAGSIQSAPIVVSAHSRISVFQAHVPKAPTWWRKQLGDHLKATEPRIRYLVIACIPPGTARSQLFSEIEAVGADFGANMVELHILEENPQLWLDFMVVDGEHVFLALQAADLTPRQCSIYLKNSTVANVLDEWFLRLLHKTKSYPKWKRDELSRL